MKLFINYTLLIFIALGVSGCRDKELYKREIIPINEIGEQLESFNGNLTTESQVNFSKYFRGFNEHISEFLESDDFKKGFESLFSDAKDTPYSTCPLFIISKDVWNEIMNACHLDSGYFVCSEEIKHYSDNIEDLLNAIEKESALNSLFDKSTCFPGW